MEIELVPGSGVSDRVEKLIRRLELRSEILDLNQYPGSTHWHLKKQGVKGTLEITWWPKQNRLWLEIRENREAAWQQKIVDALTDEFS